ncbi:MAG: ribosome maturation factor RimP [Defluviitaleaceae bacterium]|nr:ribosome maturation factor RimP [Defluviitaleaceae bacterium]
MIEKLETLLAPVATSQGCELYDIEYVKEGGDRILRLFIDKPEGIDIDDCERVSRAAEVVLDENDPITGEYRLQVSSPGVERRLKKPAHFARFIGHKVEVRLFAPLDPVSGRKKYTGVITAFADNKLTIKTSEDDQTVTFELPQISACRLIVFD